MKIFAILGIIVMIGLFAVWIDAKMNSALAPVIEEHFNG